MDLVLYGSSDLSPFYVCIMKRVWIISRRSLSLLSLYLNYVTYFDNVMLHNLLYIFVFLLIILIIIIIRLIHKLWQQSSDLPEIVLLLHTVQPSPPLFLKGGEEPDFLKNLKGGLNDFWR